MKNKVNSNCDNFWDVSDSVFSQIEGPSFLENEAKHNNYFKINPFAANKNFINLYSTGIYQ